MLEQLDTFTAFVRGRVADPHLAADLVQERLLNVVKSAGTGGADLSDVREAWLSGLHMQRLVCSGNLRHQKRESI